MKEIKIDDIKKLAELSRIRVKEEELAGLAKDLSSILRYVGEITTAIPKKKTLQQDRDTDWEPHRNVFRDDAGAHETGVFTKSLLESAPERDGDYIKVKQILP